MGVELANNSFCGSGSTEGAIPGYGFGARPALQCAPPFCGPRRPIIRPRWLASGLHLPRLGGPMAVSECCCGG
eukprot:scaffold368848_cov38-Prasinocladus_malaysianus.AAC.1